MSTFITRDGATLFYRDWGVGQPIVFSHGWPLSADAWDAQMMFFSMRGYRTIAHDRRGHGRSEQTSDHNDMDSYADDLAELFDQLDLHDAVLVGHSTGGGEVTRYIGRHGTDRLAKVVLLGAVPPLMLQTASNPEGTPLAVFDQIRAGVLDDRSQYFQEFCLPFYGLNRPHAKVSKGLCDAFWLQCMMAGIKPVYDCVEQFSETDFTEDLRGFDVPTLIAHGEDDQIVPIGASALKTARLVPNAELKIYPGSPHGLAQTQHLEFNADLLAFIEGFGAQRAAPAAAPSGP